MRVLSDINYGRLIGAVDPTITFRGRPQRQLATLQLCVLSHRYDLIFTNQGTRSVGGLIVLSLYLALTGQRKLVLSEFLPGIRRGLKGRIATIAYRQLLSRACAGVQVMTAWEVDDYEERYRIPREVLAHIPFYFFDDRVVDEPMPFDPDGKAGAFSSGRNSCDWDTVLDAAQGEGWPLTIVCTESERSRLQARADAAGVAIRSEVPRPEHDAMLRSAAIYLLCLQERSISAGHVRLMGAATRGIPLIASDIRGLAGYTGLAAFVVPPGDPQALRDAVSTALSDPVALALRMQQVTAIAASRPFSRYVREMQEFVAASLERR